MDRARLHLVDDDLTVGRLVGEILSQAGLKLEGQSRSGEEAIDRIRRTRPDLVLMDIDLEGALDGIETARAIRSFSETPIVFLTGFAHPELLERARSVEPAGYIVKPFDREDLVTTIEIILARQPNPTTPPPEQKAEPIYRHLREGIITLDAEAVPTFANEAARRILQLGDGELGNLPAILKDPCFDETAVSSWREMRDALIDGRLMTVAIKNPEGPPTYVEMRASATPGFGDNATTIIVLHDVSSGYEAEQRINRLATALRYLTDAVIITGQLRTENAKPRILFANEAFLRLTGHTEETASGSLFDLIDINTDEDELQARFASHQTFETELLAEPPGQSAFLGTWTVSPIPLNENPDLIEHVVVIRDITELRQIEESLRQSQKIEAVGRLAAGIAHDFNNLLSVINSYGDLLAMKLNEEDTAHRYVQHIRTAGDRASALVARLMAFSRREPTSPVQVHLGSLVQGMQSMLQRVIREDIEIELNIDPATPAIHVDSGQLEHAFLNLCMNARDAMPEGGRLSIATDRWTWDGEENLPVPELQEGSWARLIVSDTGVGMDEDTKARVFEPFFTTKPIGKGTGLGLPTVYGTVRQARGHIIITSAPEEGTRFELFFPESQIVEVPASEKTQEILTMPNDGSERVLVVEDEDTFADCITGVLGINGYRVELARSGGQAIEDYLARAQEFDLLITDLVLPGASGREVAQRFYEANPKLRCVFMTGYDDQADQNLGFVPGSLLLQKPFSLAQVLQQIRELLDQPAASFSPASALN